MGVLYVHNNALCECKTYVAENIKMSVKDVITQFNVKLHQHLPMDNDVFLQWQSKLIFSLDTANSIAAEPTRAKKESYFLNKVHRLQASMRLVS